MNETFRQIDAHLHERMVCPFQVDSRNAYHDLSFRGASFGRFVTEWVYCRPCAIVWEIERGVFYRAEIKHSTIIPRPDPIGERNYQRVLARRKLRNGRRTRCRR